MATIIFVEKVNLSGEPIRYGRTLKIDSDKLIGCSTKSLYVRKGFLNGRLFLSQRGNGNGGSGDICPLDESAKIEVRASLFERIKTFAEKAGAIIMPTFEIYEANGQQYIRRNKYPRFSARLSFSGGASDFEDVTMLDVCEDVADLSKAMRKAGEYLVKVSKNGR